jgi:phosphatidylserine decarboxylase
MDPIHYIDRVSKKRCIEQVYGARFLHLLYGQGILSKMIGAPISHALARLPFVSKWYGKLQRNPASAKKIAPFIKTFNVDSSEFAEPISTFDSFNDFFIRHLKPEARPIEANPLTAIIPADGRYLFYPRIDLADGFVVKGQKFDLMELLQDEKLAAQYDQGAMVLARLCPTDYHRYHFPCDATPGASHLINGWLYSVNPLAIKNNVRIFTENKRTLCVLDSQHFGKVLFLEVGATFVGAIHQTYTPFEPQKKGAEKGYFSFGGSSLILLFPPNTIQFEHDLLIGSASHTEIKCLMGQPMGQALA